LAAEDIDIGAGTRDVYLPIKLQTDRGSIDCRYYRSEGAEKAAIFVGGVGGDFDSPANNLYLRLCRELVPKGLRSLRIEYRHSTDLTESVFDALIGLEYLKGEGIKSVGLVGHSFGGAVVIKAAVVSPIIRTVVCLATQSYGADVVSNLRPGQSIFLIHGTSDTVLPPRASTSIYEMAHEPKKLLLYTGAGHVLNEAAEEIHRVVYAIGFWRN